MIFDININDNDKANLFLRNLWSNFRKEGKLVWQTFNQKNADKKSLIVGMMSSLLLSTGYMVTINYVKKGCIGSIVFSPYSDTDNLKKDEEIIDNAIKKALNYEENIELYTCTALFKIWGYAPMNYRGNLYEMCTLEANHELYKILKISLKLKAYDEEDAEMVMSKKKLDLTDFLSTMLESPIYSIGNESTKEKNIEWNIYDDSKWLERPNDIEGLLKLPHNLDNFINDFINDRNPKVDVFLKASKQYHSALKYFSFIYNEELWKEISFVKYDANPHEIANALFMSSLEVLSEFLEFDEKKCSTCGQKIYSIRQRVIKICEDYSDGYIDKKIIDSYYKDRSSFVHSGILYSDKSYTGSSIPLLAKNGDLIAQTPLVNLFALRDIIGYIFRNIFISLFSRDNIE